MKDIKGNLMVLLVASLFAMIGFAVNKFLEAAFFAKVCENNFCFSPLQFIVIGIAWVFILLIILFRYDFKISIS
jgi:hypothetical protein